MGTSDLKNESSEHSERPQEPLRDEYATESVYAQAWNFWASQYAPNAPTKETYHE